MADLSRREFAALAAAAAAAPLAHVATLFGAAITADELIARIRKNIGIDWKPDSVDTIKAGAPTTIATGIVTTSMATIAVLQQAVKARANIVITATPTFYARADVPAPPAGRGAAPQPAMPPDPIFTAKNEFIARNRLVVFRLSDHWQQRRPDPRVQGLAAALGWSRFQSAGTPEHVDVPALRLDRMASHVKDALRSRGGMRVIGDPATIVRRVGLLPGTTSIQAALKMLPGVDVIVAGEVREWESVEYVRDKVFAGEKKGLVLVGRIVSEEPGMEVCANWLKTLVSEVPVRHIAAGDPYWRPSA
jgi:putative NIF3 family GTP cyclohydrolase 1 type 2